MAAKQKILSQVEAWSAAGEKKIAILIDPDKYRPGSIAKTCPDGLRPGLFLVGGSLVNDDTGAVVMDIKRHCPETPVVLFPGDHSQLTPEADAILTLSLISGRNAEYLIGEQVRAAVRIARMGLETIPTAYILIDGGRTTSVEYVSGTRPLPQDKLDLTVATALAGEQLGLRLTYLEAGSGATTPVSAETIRAVRRSIGTPIIVGGGLRSRESIEKAFEAGADIAVVGTAIEKDPGLAAELLKGTE